MIEFWILLVLALVLLFAEAQVPGGILGLLGGVLLVLAVLRLESEVGISPLAAVLTLGSLIGAFCLFAAHKAYQAWLTRPGVGAESLIGEVGQVLGTGQVMVDGALWKALGAEELGPGTEVQVNGFEGISLRVRPIEASRD